VCKFTSSWFDKPKGMLYLGCQQITLYKATVDPKVEIAALQVETLSKAMAAEKRMMTGSEAPMEQDARVSKAAATENVLISSKSTLVALIVNNGMSDAQLDYIITVDSENLLRGWSLKDTTTLFSYRINTE
jgi:hypothetical protein